LRKQNDLLVTDVLSIFTYQMDVALEHAAQAAVKLHALTTFLDVTDVALEQGSVGASMLKEVLMFSKDPEHWKKNHH
jgi:orotate phosphoribosyltransferase